MDPPVAFRRAYAGLDALSGRTVVIAGPPLSGKSAHLVDLAAQLGRRGTVVLRAEGSYRERDVAYGALVGIWEQYTQRLESVSGEKLSEEPPGGWDSLLGGAGLPAVGGRRRTRERRWTGPPAGRTAVNGFQSFAAVWATVTDRFRAGHRQPAALLVEGAGLLDPEGRALLLEASRQVRLRPFLLALELDSSLPSFSAWEEELLGRADVDWVRFPHARPDEAEILRAREALAALEPASRELVGFVALLGGTASEVSLARIARRRTSEVAGLLGPAVSEGLLRVTENRVGIAREGWGPIVEESLPEETRRTMHRAIADALVALNPEPSLERRFLIADQYFASEAGPIALRHLVEAGRLAERTYAFDRADEALGRAVRCVPTAPDPSQRELAAQLRIDRARLLAYMGLPTESEEQVREAIEEGLRLGLSPDRLEELFLPLIPVVFVLGPRPTFRQLLLETADRLAAAKAPTAEAIVHLLLAFQHVLAGDRSEARSSVAKADGLTQGPGGEMVRALALIVQALVELLRAGPESTGALEALERVRRLVRGTNQTELEILCQLVEGRLANLRAGREEGLRILDRGLHQAERTGLLWLELQVQLERVPLLLQGASGGEPGATLRRCRSLAETLHLLPPSPTLLRCWNFEARLARQQGRNDEARERWLDLVAHAGFSHLPRWRASGLVQLSQLEMGVGAADRAREYMEQLDKEELRAALPNRLARVRAELEASLGGAGPAPAAPG